MLEFVSSCVHLVYGKEKANNNSIQNSLLNNVAAETTESAITIGDWCIPTLNNKCYIAPYTTAAQYNQFKVLKKTGEIHKYNTFSIKTITQHRIAEQRNSHELNKVLRLLCRI